MHENLKPIICRNLKILRIRKGFSQEKIGFMLNMEQNSYSRMKRGETKLDIERLQKIAKFYKISFFQLFEEYNNYPLPPTKITS
ncbi:MAG: helix-turn-helix domain-containing protein [Chitinophagaceae bacterium]